MTDYAKPSFHAEDNEWSDEETEKWRYTSGAYYTKDASDDESSAASSSFGTAGSKGAGRRRAGKSNPSVQSPLIDSVHAKVEYARRSKIVTGQARLKLTYQEKEVLANIAASKTQFSVPLPAVSSLSVEHMGEPLIEFLWQAFLDHGSDESQLVQFDTLPHIFERVQQRFGYLIPVDELGFRDVEPDDYVDFVHVCDHITQIIPSINPKVHVAEPKQLRLLCCSHGSCKHINDVEGEMPDNDDLHVDRRMLAGNYQLFVVFNQWISDTNGKIRNKHVTAIMEQVGIPYDTNRLPPSFWSYRAELLVSTYEDLERYVEAIRTDKDEDKARRKTEKLFMLPIWLKSVYTPAEIILFKHYYLSIPENAHEKDADADDEGNIILTAKDDETKDGHAGALGSGPGAGYADAKGRFARDVARFCAIVKHMGADVTARQADRLLRLHCRKIRGEYRFDFLAFVVMLYKIGTGAVRCRAVSNALRDLKANLKIFEEIEELFRRPVDGVTIVDYGGSPVVLDLLIRGPKNSLYYGAKFRVRLTMPFEGYPYRCPHLLFVTRMLSVNIINRFDGSGTMPHVEGMWDAGWTIRRLLEHVTTLLLSPDLSYVPKHLLHQAVAWVYHRAKELEYPDEMEAIRLAGARRTEGKHDDDDDNDDHDHDVDDEGSGEYKRAAAAEHPEPSNLPHLRTVLPDSFPLDMVVRDRVTTFAVVQGSIAALTKIEQIHVNFLATLLEDTERYIAAVQEIVARFGEEDEEAQAEADAEAAGQGADDAAHAGEAAGEYEYGGGGGEDDANAYYAEHYYGYDEEGADAYAAEYARYGAVETDLDADDYADAK
jgi:hypothetical protein